VIGVALGAFLAGTGPDPVREMQAPVSREAGRNLGMAVEAFEGGLASAQLVASGAVRSPVEFFMGAGQWPRRNLGKRGGRDEDRSQNQDEFARRHGVEREARGLPFGQSGTRMAGLCVLAGTRPLENHRRLGTFQRFISTALH
jgi:hypothetical protein